MLRKHGKLIKQIFRFGVIGGTAFLIDYFILVALTEWLGLHYLVSSVIAFSVSTVYNYILSVTWVFTEKKERKKSFELLIFVIFSVLGLGINSLCMWVFTDLVKWDYRFSKIGATAIVMVWNFVTRKLFLEEKKK